MWGNPSRPCGNKSNISPKKLPNLVNCIVNSGCFCLTIAEVLEAFPNSIERWNHPMMNECKITWDGFFTRFLKSLSLRLLFLILYCFMGWIFLPFRQRRIHIICPYPEKPCWSVARKHQTNICAGDASFHRSEETMTHPKVIWTVGSRLAWINEEKAQSRTIAHYYLSSALPVIL